MTESEFEAVADATLERLEQAFAESAPDVDVQSKGPGMLEVEFDNGSKLVINRHGAAREIWVAAKSGGFHFRHQDGEWRDTRDGGEFFAAVSRLASAQGGAPVLLKSR
jgi:CyaY protein